MNDIDSTVYWLAVKRVPGWGPATIRKKYAEAGSIQQVWAAVELDRVDKSSLLDQAQIEVDSCRNLDIYVLALDHPDYPRQLKELIDIEPVIYAKGRIDIVKNRLVAIVGSRKTSSYGIEVTQQIASELTAAGCTIVSGMALGIDTIAHQAALDAGGTTISVWGSGLDQVFPASNVRLAHQIVESGLVVSQYGIGMRPSNFTFPARNALIAALSEIVIVTEAQADSGSLITADWAEKFGRPVWAVPGSIYSPGSTGTHQLLAHGARLAVDTAAIVDSLGIQPTSTGQPDASELPTVSSDENLVLSVLDQGPQFIDQLIRNCSLNSSQTMAALSLLEMKNLIKKTGETYRRT